MDEFESGCRSGRQHEAPPGVRGTKGRTHLPPLDRSRKSFVAVARRPENRFGFLDMLHVHNRILLLHHLQFPLPLTVRSCQCGRPLDVSGHRAACARPGSCGEGVFASAEKQAGHVSTSVGDQVVELDGIGVVVHRRQSCGRQLEQTMETFLPRVLNGTLCARLWRLDPRSVPASDAWSSLSEASVDGQTHVNMSKAEPQRLASATCCGKRDRSSTSVRTSSGSTSNSGFIGEPHSTSAVRPCCESKFA